LCGGCAYKQNVSNFITIQVASLGNDLSIATIAAEQCEKREDRNLFVKYFGQDLEK
jgi:hypothetical protein